MVHSSPEHHLNGNIGNSSAQLSSPMGGNFGKFYGDNKETELKFSKSIPSLFNIVSQCDNLEDNTGSNR